MTRRKVATLTLIVVAAAAMSAYFVLFYPNYGMPPVIPPNGNGPGMPPVVQKTRLNVVSSPSAFPFVERWISQYNNGDNLGTVQLVYSSDADDANIPVLYSNVSNFLADHSADLVITGRAVQPTGNFTYAGSVFLPVSPQAIAVVYNVPGFPDMPSGLKLDAPTLSAVLSGNATHWNDPRITELNPDLNLPNEPIVVVHEGKAGSASELLERYLAPNDSITWPESSLTADSADMLSASVRQTPFSIGYVDFSNAIQTRMTYAALQNSDAEYVLPTSDSISRAIQNGTVIENSIVNGTETVSMPPTTSVGQLGNGSYPIVGFYYVVFVDGRVGSGSPATEKAIASLDFSKWISGAGGQQMLADIQYPSIYEQNEMLKALVDSLTTGIQRARFENATNITNNPNDSVYGQVAATGDNVFIVWQESVSSTNYDIFFKRSQNGANTFGSVTNLSRNLGFSEHPQLAATDAGVYVVWADNTSGNKEVLFAKSASGGNAFSRTMTLSNTDVSLYNQEIAVTGDNVYVVWQEQREGNDIIVLRASSDGGKTFGVPVTITDKAHPESFPKVAADEDSVHVVWSNPDQPALNYVKSDDGGATFSPVRQLNGGNDVGEAQVAVYADSVHVAWGGLNAHEVRQLLYVSSADTGATFTDPTNIDSYMLVNAMNVELAIMRGQNTNERFVHIAAQAASSDNEEILLVSTADGSAFTEAVNLSNNVGISECPSIAVSGDSIYVVWEDRTAGNNEIFLAKGTMP